ncbi:acyltransferase domain-containing protein [Streptomyces sp. NPDC006879]|uniref:acyltransferase domain-containing protein n=1 Tax=Streptomyces sp. NPDC006879 TaxID=3364767 RepID=UPI00368FD6B6
MSTTPTVALLAGVGSCVAGSLHAVRNHPEARRTLDEIDRSVQHIPLGGTVSDLLLREPGSSPVLSEPRHELLLHLSSLAQGLTIFRMVAPRCGSDPMLLLGHSLGEVTALAAAGVVTAQDAAALLVACARARAAHGSPSGALLALRQPVDATRRLLAAVDRPGLAIACTNSPTQTVVSGPASSVTGLLDHARERGVTCTLLKTGFLFHSQLLAPVAATVLATAEHIPFEPPTHPIFSPLFGRICLGVEELRQTLIHHLLHPVPFDAAIRSLHAAGAHRFLECSPRPLLAPFVRAHAPESTVVVPMRTGWDFPQVVAALATHGFPQADPFRLADVRPAPSDLPVPLTRERP